LECLPLDKSELCSNSWLAGFTDAVGNFSINIIKRKNTNNSIVLPDFRIEVSQNYPKNSEGEKLSNYFFMSKIAIYLDVALYSINHIKKDKVFNSITLRAYNINSLETAMNYFKNFSLLSSKYLDFLDWFKFVEIRKNNYNYNYKTSSYLEVAILIRNDFNINRVTFNWNHLKNSYIENI